MADENKSGGWGWFWLILVIAIVGAGYLYQKEGGKIFGPDGLAKEMRQKVYGIELRSTGGSLFEDVYWLKNGSDCDLSETNITITFYRENGEKVPITKYWASWNQNEEKEFRAPRSSYQKVVLQGTALRGIKEEKVMFDSFWTFGEK